MGAGDNGNAPVACGAFSRGEGGKGNKGPKGNTGSDGSAEPRGSEGSKGNVYVLVHGFAQRGDSWDDVASFLRSCGGTVYAPWLMDLVGPVSTDDGLRAAAQRLLNYCASVALKHGKKPVVVGYSMGGRIALEAACLACGVQTGTLPSAGIQPSDIPFSALVLESAGLGPVVDEDRNRLRERNSAWAKLVHEQGVGAFMEWWETLPLFASQQNQPTAKREAQRRQRMHNSMKDIALQLTAWGQHHQSSRETALAALNWLEDSGVPVSYFAGELDDKYCRAAACVKQNVSRATVKLFPGCGHNIHWEDPRAYADALQTVFDAPVHDADSPNVDLL